MQFHEHVDGKPLVNPSPALRAFMKQAGMFQNSDSDSVRFCGIINIDEQIHFFWPKTYRTGCNDIFSSGRSLLSVIKKYARNKGSTVSTSRDSESDIAGLLPLTALEILDDYIGHGIYARQSSDFVRSNRGKISWGKTISRIIPVKGQGNIPIYTEVIAAKHSSNYSHIISAIHRAVISKLDRVFGWYYTGSSKRIAPDLAMCKMPCSTSQALILIRKELSSLFSDREVRLFGTLIRFLESEQYSESAEDIAYTGIRNFEHIWEDMCSVIYKNDIEKLKNTIPIPAYQYKTFLKKSPLNRQRMDLLLLESNTIAILDAKYYDIQKTQPGWSDLVKQFFYERSLSIVHRDKNILNFLILPEPIAKNLPESVIVCHPEDIDSLDEFPSIGIIYHDMSDMMNKYVTHQINPSLRNHIFSQHDFK